MRLDHLLSRERTKEEIPEFIPGRYTAKSNRSCVERTQVREKAKSRKNPEHTRDGPVEMTVNLL